MELITLDELRPEPGERIFRHAWAAPLVMWAFLATPLAPLVILRAEILRAAGALPWPAWLVVAPVLLVGGALWSLCLFVLAQVVQRALSPTNWLLCARRARG